MENFRLACDKSEIKQTRKNEMEDMMLKEAVDFLDRLHRSPYNRKSKVFTIEELGIEKLVRHLCYWNMLSHILIVVWDGVSEFRDVLTNILSEKKKKRIRMEANVVKLLKESVKKCTKILVTKDAEKEPWEEGEYSVEETSNGGGYVIAGRGMTFEKVRKQLSHINALKRRLLNFLDEQDYIVEAIKEEYPSPAIRSELDSLRKRLVNHYQFLDEKLDELNAHYNGMIKQWFS